MEPIGKGPFHFELQFWVYMLGGHLRSPDRFAELLLKSK